MRARTNTKAFLAFALAATLLAAPTIVEGQRGPLPGRLRPLGPSVDLLESALQNGDEIGLTPEQRVRLEEFQTEFLESTAFARELVEDQRAQLRGAMERIRSEREEARTELREMLTEEQVRQVQGLARGQRPRPRSDRERFRGRSGRQNFRGGGDTFRTRSFHRGLTGRFVPGHFSRRGASLRRGLTFGRGPTLRRGRGSFPEWGLGR